MNKNNGNDVDTTIVVGLVVIYSFDGQYKSKKS